MSAQAKIIQVGKWVQDGWTNVLTGLGLQGADTRVSSQINWKPMTEQDASILYAADSMAAKIVDKPVDDATKKGYKWTGIEESQVKKLVAKLNAVFFDDAIKEAWKKARLTGGAGILKLYNDQLQLEDVVTGKREIKSLLVLSRHELRAPWEDCQKDVLNPNFGLPVQYTFSGRASNLANTAELKIHYTRIVRFVGAWLPDILRSYSDQWGDSYLNRPQEALRNYAHAHDSVNMAIKDLSVAVFKIKGLGDMLTADDGDKMLQQRLAAVNLSKSIARAVVIDADGEDFDYRTRNLTGATDLVNQAANRLAAETDMPQTVLFGTSPTGGLGQSGNHESENWYGYIESAQANYLKPKMMEIAKEACEELGINAEALDIEFNKLWQMSDKEAADVKNIMAQVDERYINMGVLDAYEVTEARFGGSKYSIETSIKMQERDRQERSVDPLQIEGGKPSLDPGLQKDVENIQGQALNGAQVASLIQVSTMVQANQLDPKAASGILKMAFPTITEQQMTAILTKSKVVVAPEPQQRGGF